MHAKSVFEYKDRSLASVSLHLRVRFTYPLLFHLPLALSPLNLAPPSPPPTALRAQMEQIDLKYGSDHVLALILPVSFCMMIVVATLKSVAFYSTTDAQFV